MAIQMICDNCEHVFECYQSDIDKGRRFCSLACRSAFRFNKALPPAGATPVHFACKECGKDFTMKQSYLTAYRKKYGRDPLFCSMPCSSANLKKVADAKNTATCLGCNKSFTKSRRASDGYIYRQQKYCSKACMYNHRKIMALERFDNGEITRYTKARNGYVHVHIPSLVTGKKHSILEHRFNMSRHLGRDLTSEETVHHRDGNRANNDLSNLELFTSRHGPGQRVVDQVSFAIDMLNLYPEFLRTAGYKLVKLE